MTLSMLSARDAMKAATQIRWGRSIVVVALATASLAGCGESPRNENRGLQAVEACRDRGGVVAFEDQIVICRDQTSHEVPE